MDDHWQPTVRRVPRLVGPVPIDPRGIEGPTRGAARGPRWRRTSHHLYVPAHVADDVPEQRILEAFAVSGGRGAVTGWAALRLLGAAFFDGLAPDGRTRLPVSVLQGGARFRATELVHPSREAFAFDEVVLRHGIRCVRPERALVHEVVRRGDLREAVVAVDMALAGEVTSIRRIEAHLTTRAGERGVAVTRRALALASEGSASPQESRFRLVWQLDAGWGAPLVNRAVHDLAGRFLGRPDLIDPERGVVGEYAGADHRARARHRKDVRREDLFRRAGLEYVEVVGADLRDRTLVVDRMRAAERRTGLLPRRWRLGAAPLPLDDVLDHREAMIAQHEGA